MRSLDNYDDAVLFRQEVANLFAGFISRPPPEGRQLAPVMPYHQYAALTDEDASALAKFLKSTKPVSNDVPDPVGPDQKAPLPYLTVKMPD